MATVLVNIPMSPVQAGVLISVPSSGWYSFPTSSIYQYIVMQVNLQDADKRATGNQIAVNIIRSLDGVDPDTVPVAGVNWSSYGPNGLTVKIYVAGQGFVTVTDPDPTIRVPLDPLLGHVGRLQFQITGTITQAGATISGE